MPKLDRANAEDVEEISDEFTTSSEIDEAMDLFAAFHGYEPEPDCEDIIELDDTRTVALYIGELDAVVYRIEGEAEPIFHRFKESDRPLLYVSSDGSEIVILKGGFRFTEKGFEG